MNQVFVGLNRAHIRPRQYWKSFGQGLGRFQLLHGGKHFVAQILQPHIPVCLPVFFYNLGQNTGQRLIIVIILFEIEQSIQQRSPFSVGYAERKQEQDCEIGCFFDNNSLIIQIGRNNRRRNSPVG